MVWYPSKKPLLKAWGYISGFTAKLVKNIPFTIIKNKSINNIGVKILPTLSITLLALNENKITIPK